MVKRTFKVDLKYTAADDGKTMTTYSHQYYFARSDTFAGIIIKYFKRYFDHSEWQKKKT